MQSLLGRNAHHLTLVLFVASVPLLGGWEGCVPAEPPPEECICTAEYAPVCGVDGNTYGNACAAACAEVVIQHDGECLGGICIEDADCPVGSRCIVDVLPLAEGGDAPDFCAPEDCGPIEGHCEACVCPEIWAPVCGIDGNTYGNACEAECNRVGISHEGECGGAGCWSDADCAPFEFCDILVHPCDGGAGGGGSDGAEPSDPSDPSVPMPPPDAPGTCRVRECPAVLCAVYCEFGYATDERGCPGCECLPPPECPPVLCDLYCEFGYATDERGCETCSCLPPPPAACMSDADCAEGQSCEVYCTGVCTPDGECPPPACYGTCVDHTSPPDDPPPLPGEG